MMGMNTALSSREATLRSAATAALAGIALVQTIELPALLTHGRQLGLLSLAATALCVAVAAALVVAPASAARRLWRTVSATAVAVLAGWAATRVFAVPGTGGRGEGTILGAGAALAAAALVAALVAGRPYGARARRLAKAAALLVAVVPGVTLLIIAMAPGRANGVTALSSGAHVHHIGDPEVGLVFRAIPGAHGGQWVYQAQTAAPGQTTLGAVLALAAAALFVYGAISYLRRRSRAHADAGVALAHNGAS